MKQFKDEFPSVLHFCLENGAKLNNNFFKNI